MADFLDAADQLGGIFSFEFLYNAAEKLGGCDGARPRVADLAAFEEAETKIRVRIAGEVWVDSSRYEVLDR